MASPSTEAEAHQEMGVAATPVVVEVRSSCTDAHELDVDVETAADAEHVAEQAAVGVYRVGLRFRGTGARRCRAGEDAS